MPKGDRLAQGGGFRIKRDVDGENQNPILDTCQYEVDFTNGDVTELTANAIADRMYAQCDKDVNDMFLIDYFVYSIKTERVILLQDHQLAVNGKPCKKRSTVGC